jgi:hypothetical protein
MSSVLEEPEAMYCGIKTPLTDIDVRCACREVALATRTQIPSKNLFMVKYS